MDREAWRAAIHGIAKSRTRLSDWTNWLNLRSHLILCFFILGSFWSLFSSLPVIGHSNFTFYGSVLEGWIILRIRPFILGCPIRWHISLVQFSRSVMSDSLWPHEPQYARPPCPSPTPRVHPNPCPLSQWCHPTISSSVVPFSSCPQSFPALGSFQKSQFFASGGQSTGVSASA